MPQAKKKYNWTKARAEAVTNITAKKKKIDLIARKNFGQMIQQRRQEIDMTQPELAEKTNQKFFTFVSNVENGRAKIPTVDLKIWARALKVNRNQFVQNYLFAADPPLYNALFSAAKPKKFSQED